MMFSMLRFKRMGLFLSKNKTYKHPNNASKKRAVDFKLSEEVMLLMC